MCLSYSRAYTSGILYYAFNYHILDRHENLAIYWTLCVSFTAPAGGTSLRVDILYLRNKLVYCCRRHLPPAARRDWSCSSSMVWWQKATQLQGPSSRPYWQDAAYATWNRYLAPIVLCAVHHGWCLLCHGVHAVCFVNVLFTPDILVFFWKQKRW